MENKRTLFGGIFFLCLSLLMYEIILTRVFSVLLWYHFAFLVISVALFGNGVSALFLYIFRKFFPEENLEKNLQIISFFVPVSMIISLTFVLKIEFNPELSFKIFSKDFLQLAYIFILSSLPFLFGGLCLALTLYHRSKDIHRIYFFDLFGAGLGCLLTVPILSIFGGLSGIIYTAAISGFVPLSFSYFNFEKNKNLFIKLRKPISILLILLSLSIAIIDVSYKPIFKIKVAKMLPIQDFKILFKKWNSFSMVIVFPGKPHNISWAVSPKYKGPVPKQMRIMIDAGALTEISEFDGDLKSVEFTKYDYSSMIHFVKKDYDCCVIGPGGGKDILAALASGAKSVVGVEVNPIIVKDIMRDRFLDFSGHLYEHPKVDIVIEDGRSYIRRTDKKFDVIQLTMVDTSAATAAGAYVLSENSLYTVDAFLDYFSKLKKDGILTVSWVNMRILEGGTRLVSLAREALESKGITDVSKHIIVLMHPNKYNVNVLIKPEPFTKEETELIKNKIDELGFEVVYVPGFEYPKNIITDIITNKDLKNLYSSYHLDVSPVTDEKPFFFYQNRLSDFFKVLFKSNPDNFFGAGLFILSKIIWICVIFTILFLILPLFFWGDKGVNEKISFGKKLHRIIYFICLGIGFMFIEIPLLQRFVLFLGHPIYSLAVVLLGLLCFCGVGSFLTEKIHKNLQKNLLLILIVLILTIFIYYLALTPLLKKCLIYPIYLKVLLTLLFLAPIGLMLGMCFPAGIRLMDTDTHSLIPWFWAMNSASSVLGSVLGAFISINFGIGNTMLIGAGIYLLALFIIMSIKNVAEDKNTLV